MNVESVDNSWEILLDQIQLLVGKRPSDINAVLFLIGMQELGTGPKRFSKEAKQDLMHIAVCSLLSQSGYYAFMGHDKDGWPQWSLLKPVPHQDLLTQESFLKEHIIRYFKTVID